MTTSRQESFLKAFIRRGKRFIGRHWGSKKYVIYYKSLDNVERDAEYQDEHFRFFAATPDDIPWMSGYLDEWARWSYGGKQVRSTEEVLREQFDGGDITIVGAENKPDGALVFVGSLCYDEPALRMLGDAFTPPREVSLRRGWVPPEFRGRRVAIGGMHFLAAEAARQGATGIWSLIRIGNTPSCLMHIRCGHKKRGEARLLTRLKRRYVSLRLDPSRRWHTQPIDPSTEHL